MDRSKTKEDVNCYELRQAFYQIRRTMFQYDYRIRYLLFLLPALLAGAPATVAQVKYERETRIRPSAVPTQARAFADTALGARKIRWLKEFGLDAFSYEAKAKKDGRRYSIEFDTAGKVQDVEMEIKLSSLDPALRKKIDATLSGLFTHPKITKTQLQWTGPEPVLQALIQAGAGPENYTERVEIVFKCRENGRPKLYEALFDASGALLSKLEIIPRNTDNLDY